VRRSNDTIELEATTWFDGPALEFDLPGVEVGLAEYDEGPTGCTVLKFPDGASAATDIRGGAVGVTGAEYDWLHGVCFAGGSVFGLEAAFGVGTGRLADADYEIGWGTIPFVAGAIIWDWHGRDNAIYPDAALGRAAYHAAHPGRFPLGKRGAGRSAGVGQGAAYRDAAGVKVAVFTVVNALGSVVDRDGSVLTGSRRPVIDEIDERIAKHEAAAPPRDGNTTLTLVATNRKMSHGSLTQLARTVHSSMARAIQPFHTESDGDVLFAVTTNEVDHEPPAVWETAVIASELAWDAVLSAVPSRG
jgi:6-aminohexanoate-oligomer endohydrolase